MAAKVIFALSIICLVGTDIVANILAGRPYAGGEIFKKKKKKYRLVLCS